MSAPPCSARAPRPHRISRLLRDKGDSRLHGWSHYGYPLSMAFPRRSALLAALAAFALAAASCGQSGDTTAATSGKTSHAASSTSGGDGGGGSGPAPKPLVILNWNTHNFFNDKKD